MSPEALKGFNMYPEEFEKVFSIQVHLGSMLFCKETLCCKILLMIFQFYILFISCFSQNFPGI